MAGARSAMDVEFFFTKLIDRDVEVEGRHPRPLRAEFVVKIKAAWTLNKKFNFGARQFPLVATVVPFSCTVGVVLLYVFGHDVMSIPQTGGTEGPARLYQERSITYLFCFKRCKNSVELFVSCRIE